MLAAGLRFWGLDHGLPRNYVPDTTVVRAALSLGAGANPFRGDELPTQYPYLVPYLLFAVYGAWYLAGRLTGDFSGIDDFEVFALARPEVFFYVARMATALAGTAMVLLVILAGRRLMPPRAAFAAGMFTATSLVLVQLSHQARPHIFTATLLVASLWLALRWIADRRRACLLGSWLAVGLAGSATPYGLIGAVIPLTAATLERPAASGGSRIGHRRLTVIGLCLCAVIVLACYPGMLLRPAASFGYDQEADVVTIYRGNFGSPKFINGRGFAKLAGWFPAYEPVLALLTPAAALAIFRRRGQRRRWLMVATYPILFTAIYGSYEVIYPRYILSLIPFFALPAGYLADRLLAAASRWGTVRGSWAARGAAAAVALALFTPSLVQAVRLDLLLARDDTRLLAETWIEEQLPRDGRLALEPHGIKPAADRESLERMAREHPGQLGIKALRRLRAGGNGGGRSLSRLWYLKGYRQRRAEELASAEGLRYVAAVVPGDRPREDVFYRTLRAGATRLATFSPLVPGRPAADTRLPTELGNPLTGLWRVERCGPIVEIWELPR